MLADSLEESVLQYVIDVYPKEDMEALQERHVHDALRERQNDESNNVYAAGEGSRNELPIATELGSPASVAGLDREDHRVQAHPKEHASFFAAKAGVKHISVHNPLIVC